MENYVEAIRAAAAASSPRDLKPALDFLLELATADYKGGALDEVELWDIINEYNDALMSAGAVNYT
jgi:hypothetical protein